MKRGLYEKEGRMEGVCLPVRKLSDVASPAYVGADIKDIILRSPYVFTVEVPLLIHSLFFSTPDD